LAGIVLKSRNSSCIFSRLLRVFPSADGGPAFVNYSASWKNFSCPARATTTSTRPAFRPISTFRSFAMKGSKAARFCHAPVASFSVSRQDEIPSDVPYHGFGGERRRLAGAFKHGKHVTGGNTHTSASSARMAEGRIANFMPHAPNCLSSTTADSIPKQPGREMQTYGRGFPVRWEEGAWPGCEWARAYCRAAGVACPQRRRPGRIT
jgi:hypothetical protein